MSFDLKLFRNEVRANHKNLDFLEDEKSVEQFSDEQFATLQKRLKHYKYEIESENDSVSIYNYDKGKLGITAILSKNCLTFQCAGGNENGLFEIFQTSAELCENDFSVLNLQEGTWEGSIEEEEKDPEKYYITDEDIEEAISQANKKQKPWWKLW
jgi:hypothetical protein